MTPDNLQKNTPHSSSVTLHSVFLIFFLFFAIPVFSQSADEIDYLLSLDAVNYGQAAWLILNAADIQNAADEGSAFNYAAERNWISRNADINGSAKLNEVSLLIMQSFNIKGGVLYTLFKNTSAALAARYAYRELVYINVIYGRADPQMEVSGDLLLYMVGSILERIGN